MTTKETPLMGGMDAKLLPGMLRVMFFRHGEATVNLDSKDSIGGRLNNSPLTKRGAEQAVALGDHLRSQGVVFDCVFSSSAVRSIQTAFLACDCVGFPRDRVEVTDELLEVDQGMWTGKSRRKKYTPKVIEQIKAEPWTWTPPGGESQRDVEVRMVRFVERCIVEGLWRRSDKSRPMTVGVFSHGMAIRCFLRSILGSSPSFTWKIQMSNANVTTLFFDPVIGWRLISVNTEPKL